jgi:hypothetical protein
MKRFNSKLEEDINGEYVLYSDHINEIKKNVEKHEKHNNNELDFITEVNYWDGHKTKTDTNLSDSNFLNDTNYYDGHPNKGWD